MEQRQRVPTRETYREINGCRGRAKIFTTSKEERVHGGRVLEDTEGWDSISLRFRASLDSVRDSLRLDGGVNIVNIAGGTTVYHFASPKTGIRCLSNGKPGSRAA